MSSSGVFSIMKLIDLSPFTYEIVGMSENFSSTLAISFNLIISPFLSE